MFRPHMAPNMTTGSRTGSWQKNATASPARTANASPATASPAIASTARTAIATRAIATRENATRANATRANATRANARQRTKSGRAAGQVCAAESVARKRVLAPRTWSSSAKDVEFQRQGRGVVVPRKRQGSAKEAPRKRARRGAQGLPQGSERRVRRVFARKKKCSVRRLSLDQQHRLEQVWVQWRKGLVYSSRRTSFIPYSVLKYSSKARTTEKRRRIAHIRTLD